MKIFSSLLSVLLAVRIVCLPIQTLAQIFVPPKPALSPLAVTVTIVVLTFGIGATYVIHTQATRVQTTVKFPATQNDLSPYWDWNSSWYQPGRKPITLPPDYSGNATWFAIPTNAQWPNVQDNHPFVGILTVIIQANSKGDWHDYPCTFWVTDVKSFVMNYCGQVCQGTSLSSIYVRMPDEGGTNSPVTLFRIKPSN